MTDMSVTKAALKHANETQATGGGRRCALLDAAAAVFVKKGFHNTKVSDIVAAAGVAQGTFYLYFKTKMDVLEELIGGCCHDVIAKLKASSSAKAAVTSVQELRAHNIDFLVDVFESLEKQHHTAKLILNTADTDAAVDDFLTAFRRSLVNIVRSDLKKGMAGGYIRRLNPDIIAEGMVGMIYHIAFERFVRGRRLGKSIRKLAEEIVDFELNGISCNGRTEGVT